MFGNKKDAMDRAGKPAMSYLEIQKADPLEVEHSITLYDAGLEHAMQQVLAVEEMGERIPAVALTQMAEAFVRTMELDLVLATKDPNRYGIPSFGRDA